jgi:hypothetical protein
MRAILLGILISGLTASVGFSQESSQPLQLKIKSDKQVYEEGEEVVINLMIKNITNNEFILETNFWKGNLSKGKFLAGEIKYLACGYNMGGKTPAQVIMIDSVGADMHFCNIAQKAPMPKMESITIQPRGSFETIIPYCKGYQKLELKPGIYSIKVQHDFNESTITSNTITIEVEEKEPTTKKNIITLGNLVYVDMNARNYTTQHPLVCVEGGDFPTGKELIFRHLESGESIHAVFPKGIMPPKDLDGEFIFHGHFQSIQKWGHYKLKKPGKDYRYFVVSSYETVKHTSIIEAKESEYISGKNQLSTELGTGK